MLIVPSNSKLVNRDSLSKPVITCAQSKQDTSSANENESLIVKLFDVNDVNNGTITLVSLYDIVFIAKRMSWREVSRSVTGLDTLLKP